jgi:GLPGLI family protein
LILIFTLNLSGQTLSGTIEFERYQDWLAGMKLLPWVTQEEIERDALVWGNRSGKNGAAHLLDFSGQASKFYPKPQEANYGYSWLKREYVLYRDLENRQVHDLVTLLDKDYIVEGEMPKFKWKILNEIRDIEGYLCMKAESKHPLHGYKIYAWFTDQIPFRGGPEGIGGLPGMILSLEIEDVIEVLAIKVDLDADPEVLPPQKKKAKKISYEEYRERYNRYLEKSMKRERNPFWELRM